jgi:hypothetical protein
VACKYEEMVDLSLYFHPHTYSLYDMARSKKNKNLANQVKRGRYKRDHSYIDISDEDDDLYEDGKKKPAYQSPKA